MKRHSRASGKPAKPRRSQPSKSKGGKPPKVAGSRSSHRGAETEVGQLRSELNEAREQQTATSEVLRVISSSPGDLQPVFATILENAIRVCDAKWGTIHQWDGEALQLMAMHNLPPAFAEARRRRASYRPHPRSLFGRMLESRAPVHFADATSQPAYVERLDQVTIEAIELGGVRSVLAVPMLKENKLVGGFAISRQEARPFTDKQIELVKNFAAQAVIAIENARLLNELRQRTDDLSETLQQQTATSEILEVISNSPTDSQPAFDAIVRSGLKLFTNAVIAISLPDDGKVKLAAIDGADRADLEALRARYPLPLSREYITSTAILDRREMDFADARETPAQLIPGGQNFLSSGYRGITVMPMMRGGTAIGAISVVRRQPGALSDKQRELLRSFANQAVIAIENARVLGELRERTEEVVKLNQQLERRVADQVGEIERMGRLRRFLPPQVADLIVASGNEKQLESHRREITALFCDLRGFTGFTETADAEDVMALLRDYHAAIGEIIIKYSGTLERYAGDGVMVVFNDPVPVEKPALQAVLMALEMRDVIGALTEKWRRLGHEIGFGIGIAHGFATLGTIGFEGRFDYAAIGTVANVASRLCDEAKPGQILISPRVFMAVENAVKVEPVGEFALKGIRRPLAAYNVLAAASATA